MSAFRFDVISGVSYSAGGRDQGYFLFLSGILKESCSPYLQLPILHQNLESVFAMATINRLAIFFLLLKSLVSSEALSPKKSGTLSILAMPLMAAGRYPRGPARQAQHYAKAVIMR